MQDAQHARREVVERARPGGEPAVGEPQGDRVDGEVAPREVVGQRRAEPHVGQRPGPRVALRPRAGEVEGDPAGAHRRGAEARMGDHGRRRAGPRRAARRRPRRPPRRGRARAAPRPSSRSRTAPPTTCTSVLSSERSEHRVGGGHGAQPREPLRGRAGDREARARAYPRAAPTLRSAARATAPERTDARRSYRPHPTPAAARCSLTAGDRVLAVVEDRRGQRGVGAGGETVDHVLRRPDAARRDDGHVDRLADRPREREVVAVLRPVAVHRGEQDLPRAALHALARPRDGVAPGRRAPAGHVDLPAVARAASRRWPARRTGRRSAWPARRRAPGVRPPRS